MPHETVLTAAELPELAFQKRYFFSDLEVICSTNQPALLSLLDGLLGSFPEPARVRGRLVYALACFENASQFPLALPDRRKHTETIRLMTETKLRYYLSQDDYSEYLSYAELPTMNGPVLTALYPDQQTAVTQLLSLEQYQPLFLRRCVLLLALGHLLRSFRFEPCHAAAVTSPGDARRAALIFGLSGSGKTTLSIGCALYGFGLLGDDLVTLRECEEDARIHVHALNTEASVRKGTLDLWPQLAFLCELPADFRGKRHCDIEQLRPGALDLEADVRFLIFPTLVEEGPSQLVPLSKGRTLHELIDQCMRIEKTYPQSQEKLFGLLSKLAEQAAGYRLLLARNTDDGPRLLQALFTGGADG
ncbi:MAG TPA: hypothetical protein VFA41_10530 [Ktedonobacteraceae bacterium]|jgi:hypothetical protein|nr:hypothetical protein [Ktedonobacteraceae bacterium]